MKVEKSNCVFCGASEFRNYLKLRNFFYKRCCSCDLVQLVPLPKEKELEEFYNENYYSYNFEENSNDKKEAIKIQNEEQYGVIARNFKVSEDSRVLDYGCGVGSFLDTINEKGHKNIYGFEFNKISAEIIKTKGYKYIDIYNDKEKFDIITMWDVAEHLLKPLEVFKLLFEKLNFEGVLVIGTTRIDDFVDKTSFGYSMWADPPAHTILYNRKLLFKMLKKAGFKSIIEDKKHSISNIYISKYKMVKRAIKKLLFFYKTDRLSNRGDFGSYLIVVAKKVR